MNIRFLSAAAAIALTAASSFAQTTITQWNFNSPVPDANTGTGTTNPSTGIGTSALLGGITQTFASGDASGGSSDPAVGDDSGWQTTAYPAQGIGSGTAGIEFAVSTSGYTGIVVSWDHRHSNTSSRFSQFQYSTDGVNFTPGATFEANALPNGGDTWYNTRQVDLSAISGANNNPNFKFRIVAVFDPALGNAYSAATASSTYAGGGTNRFDMVTVRGTGSQSVPPLGNGTVSPTAVCTTATSVTLAVAVSPGLNPASTGLGVVADLTQIGGSAAQTLFDDATNGDAVQGDNIFTYAATLSGNLTPGPKNLPFTVSDSVPRSTNGSVTLQVGDCSQNSAASVVISAIYGGGGNSGAILYADYVELHNRTGSAVSLSGWSLQYAPSFSQSFTASTTINLSGSIPAGGFLLVQTNRGSDTNGLPFTADQFGYNVNDPQDLGIGIANDAGRLALCSLNTPIGTNCADPSIVDFVGYGSNSICFEGVAATGNASNTTAAVRKQDGCQDSNQNFNDFDIVFTPFPRNLASSAVSCGVAQSFPLTVARAGLGSGTISSNPAGINCGADCSESYTSGTQVTLTATPGPAANFTGWTGDCTGTGPCVVSMTQARSVTATFQCKADIDGNGAIQPADVAAAVSTWFTSVQQSTIAGDFDGNGSVQPADIAFFVNAWFTALNSGC